MSVECSECGRDLRGGHDPSCSRYDLQYGVAALLGEAAGQIVDEEWQPHPLLLKLADDVIALVRLDRAAKEG